MYSKTLTGKFWYYLRLNSTSYYWLYIGFYTLTFLFYSLVPNKCAPVHLLPPPHPGLFFSKSFQSVNLLFTRGLCPKVGRATPTGTPRWIHVDSTSILHRYVEDQILMNFRFISTYFFGVILLIERSTPLTRTFLDVISMVEKSTLFSRTLFDLISMVEKSTLFPRTFFDVILMGKNSTSFLVSCKLMKTFEKVFPVFVTLNSWLLQGCSL